MLSSCTNGGCDLLAGGCRAAYCSWQVVWLSRFLVLFMFGMGLAKKQSFIFAKKRKQ